MTSANSERTGAGDPRALLLPLVEMLGLTSEFDRFVASNGLIAERDKLDAVAAELMALAGKRQIRGREDAMHLLQWVSYSAGGELLVTILFTATSDLSLWVRKRAYIAIGAHSDFPRAVLEKAWNGGHYLRHLCAEHELSADEGLASLRPFVLAGLVDTEDLVAQLISERPVPLRVTVAGLLPMHPNRERLIEKLREIFQEGNAQKCSRACRGVMTLAATELKACLIDAIYNPSASAWSAAAAEALQSIRLSDDEVNSILGRWKDVSATLQALILRAIENSLDALSGSCRQGLKKVFLLMIVARPDSSGLATLQRMLAKLEHMEKTPGG